MGMGFKVSPYSGQSAIAMLPRKDNIPKGNKDWELTTCKVCGAECWRNVPLINEAKKLNPNLREMCSECAIKQSVKNNIK